MYERMCSMSIFRPWTIPEGKLKEMRLWNVSAGRVCANSLPALTARRKEASCLTLTQRSIDLLPTDVARKANYLKFRMSGFCLRRIGKELL